MTPKFLLEHSGGRISLTRLILFSWAAMTIGITISIWFRLIVLSLPLPPGTDQFLTFLELLSPSYIGGYALGKRIGTTRGVYNAREVQNVITEPSD